LFAVLSWTCGAGVASLAFAAAVPFFFPLLTNIATTKRSTTPMYTIVLRFFCRTPPGVVVRSFSSGSVWIAGVGAPFGVVGIMAGYPFLAKSIFFLPSSTYPFWRTIGMM